MRDRYYMVVVGPMVAIRWLFPTHEGHFEQLSSTTWRHTFPPAPKPITVERELRQIAARWQEAWDHRLQDEAISAPADHATGLPTPPRITSLGELFDHLFAIRMTTLRPTTVERDRYYVSIWRRELGDAMRLHDLSEHVLAAARAKLASATSPTTANDAFSMLKTYLGWAFNQGLLLNGSFRTIRRLRVSRAERRTRAWWTAEEVQLALGCAAQDKQARTAVLYTALGCFLGLRPEEAIMQRWEDLDLDAVNPKTGDPKPVAHVVGHDGWEPKDGEARDIPICTHLHHILVPLRKPKGYLLEADVVRTNRKAHAPWAYRYDPKKVWKRVIDRVVAAGGKAITAYGMRHSFSSNLLIAGVSDVKVARWMGHADTRMVHRHYGHLLSYDADINAVRYDSKASS